MTVSIHIVLCYVHNMLMSDIHEHKLNKRRQNKTTHVLKAVGNKHFEDPDDVHDCRLSIEINTPDCCCRFMNSDLIVNTCVDLNRSTVNGQHAPGNQQ